MNSNDTTYRHFHQEGREAIKKEHLRRVFMNMLMERTFNATDGDRNYHFIDTLVRYFDDIFKTPIDDETYNPDEIEAHYIGEYDKWDYEVVIFGRNWYFVCETPEKCEEKLVDDLNDNPETLFSFNPIYVCGCLKEDNTHTEEEINYDEPDPETDDVPLFDTEDCPCCMEKWGMKETTTFVGNHPTRKVLKKTKTFTIKRNTYCGHPICMTCFDKCCEELEPKCPMCRKKYQDTGDRVVETIATQTPISEEIAQDLFRFQDPNLFDFVDVERLIRQSVVSDGLEHLLGLQGFCETTMYYGDEYLFGCDTE